MLQERPPLQITDFGGGITDNDIPGAANQYKKADNLDITNDLKLLQRPGSDILSNTQYQLPLGNHRVSRLINFDKDSELLAAQQKKIYYGSNYGLFTGTWTEVAGPTSGAAFNSNDCDTQIHEAQWQKHIFLTSESGDKPIKLYRDNSSALQLRTAGLPEITLSTYPVDGGLADAITLANDLRTKMITHYNNSVAGGTMALPDATYAHISSAGLTTQYSNVNGSVAATNLATLITLVNLLRGNYNTHVTDIIPSPSVVPINHLVCGGLYGYPWVETPLLNFYPAAHPDGSIQSNATIADILPYLNDLRDKWNCHTFALATHFNAVSIPDYPSASHVDLFGANATSVARVVTYKNVKIDPSHSYFLTYVQNLYNDYLGHCDSYGHHTRDTFNRPANLGSGNNLDVTPDDITEAIILLAHTAYYFWRHFADANYTFDSPLGLTPTSPTAKVWQVIEGDSTAASADITGMSTLPTCTAAFAEPYTFVMPRYGTQGATYIWTTAAPSNGVNYVTNYPFSGASGYLLPRRVTAKSGTTTTVSGVAEHDLTNAEFVFATSYFHHYFDHDRDLVTPAVLKELFEAISFDFTLTTSLTTLGTLAKAISDKIKAHSLGQHAAFADVTFPTTSSSAYSVAVISEEYASSTGYKYGLYYAGGTFGANRFLISQATNLLFPSHYKLSGGKSVPTNLWGTNRYPDLGLEGYYDTVPTGARRNYEVLYRQDYHVGAPLYKDFGAPSEGIAVVEFDSPASILINGGELVRGGSRLYSTSISTFAALTNAAGDNYDTTNVMKEIYRTLNGGAIYYKVTELPNSTTSYSDATLDSTLLGDSATGVAAAARLYTTGGVVANDTPPIAKYIHILNNIAYYGGVTESSVAQPQRLRQSIANDPDSCPTDFFLDFDQDVTGISSIKNNLIVGCTSSTHRVSGAFDELGRGGMVREAISDAVGCINQESMVKTDVGLFWAGQNGFYWSDGYQVLRISPHLETTFLSYTSSATQKSRLVGAYRKNERKVVWAIQTGSADASASIIWVLDLDQGIKQQMPFTTWSGDAGFLPTALTYFNNKLYRGSANGYVFYHDSTVYMDPKVNTAVAATSWNKYTVFWDFKTCDGDFGGSAMRKYVTRLTPQFRQYTNLSVGLSVDADRGRHTGNLTPIRSRKLADWGDANLSPPASFVATAGTVIDEMRRNISTCLKCDYMAVELKNGYVVVTSSDVAGVCTTADLGAGLFSATLTVAAKKWPNYVVDYYLKIAGVSYLVGVRTSDTIISCTGAPSFAAGVAWELWGYPKNERAHLLSYELRYALMGDKQRDYAGATSSDGGQNA